MHLQRVKNDILFFFISAEEVARLLLHALGVGAYHLSALLLDIGAQVVSLVLVSVGLVVVVVVVLEEVEVRFLILARVMSAFVMLSSLLIVIRTILLIIFIILVGANLGFSDLLVSVAFEYFIGELDPEVAALDPGRLGLRGSRCLEAELRGEY
jgi:hypothetical protein